METDPEPNVTKQKVWKHPYIQLSTDVLAANIAKRSTCAVNAVEKPVYSHAEA